MKLVYFDEGTITDYLTILNNGTLLEIHDEKNESKKSASVAGNIGIAPRLSKLFSGFIGVGVDMNAQLGKSADKLIQKSITNALLSDFLSESRKQPNGLCKLENHKVFPGKTLLLIIKLFHHTLL